mmetsp:Transcript_25730/g.39957  ORF Transcript_25730/g.39957 Transcript_25730/m.39957 type:complete len:284 (+) Transcript_25730:471-1322(+)
MLVYLRSLATHYHVFAYSPLLHWDQIIWQSPRPSLPMSIHSQYSPDVDDRDYSIPPASYHRDYHVKHDSQQHYCAGADENLSQVSAEDEVHSPSTARLPFPPLPMLSPDVLGPEHPFAFAHVVLECSAVLRDVDGGGWWHRKRNWRTLKCPILSWEDHVDHSGMTLCTCEYVTRHIHIDQQQDHPTTCPVDLPLQPNSTIAVSFQYCCLWHYHCLPSAGISKDSAPNSKSYFYHGVHCLDCWVPIEDWHQHHPFALIASSGDINRGCHVGNIHGGRHLHQDLW